MTVDNRLLDLDSGVEGLVNYCAVANIADLGADERPALAGLYVLEFDDLEQPVVEFESDSVLQVIDGDLRHVRSFWFRCGPGKDAWERA